MIPPLPPLKVTLLEKAAADNGFDLPQGRDGNCRASPAPARH